MQEVYPRLWVGDDQDYLKAKDLPGWSFLRPVKDGPGGHRQTCGYVGRGAPKDHNYFFCRDTQNHMALNLVDTDDPNHFNHEAIDPGLDFIGERLAAGDKVLSACNKGISRGPSLAMMYLGKIRDLPANFHEAFKIFKVLYDKYDPGQGIKFYVKQKFRTFKG